MNQSCPRCYALLAHSEVGDLCVQCGYIQRRHHNRVPEPDDNYQNHSSQNDDIRPSNLESPSGLDSLLFPEKTPEKPSYQTPSDYNNPVNNNIDNHPTTPGNEKPQIINHHSSSQYRKRLEEHKKRLELPEIESAIEPESSLDAHYPTLPMQHPPEASHISSPGVASLIDSSLQTEGDEPDVVEVNEPHRPSPYLLNMVPNDRDKNKEPDSYHQPKYHSPLKSTHTKPSTTPPNPISSQPTNEPPSNLPPKAEDALSRADALLAAAASPSKESTGKNINYLIIIVVLLIFFGLGGFFAFSLLNPSSTNIPSPSSTSPTTSGAIQSSSTSPTPSNQTESAKRDSKRKDDLNEISTALSAYKKTNGNYPIGEDISALEVLTESSPPYIDEIANDPKSDEESGEIIKYSYSSDGNKYTLTASLENKQDPDASDGFYILKSP